MMGRDATGFAVEDERLARDAAAGDASALAALNEHYGGRVYNFAYRVTGSERDAADATEEAFRSVMRRLPRMGDRELAFGQSVFSAARAASYDLMEKRPRGRPRDAGPETQPGEVGEASIRLPEHQREALALRELERFSYDEIATIMETNRNAVAQLISRARINLSDELHGTPLAAVAAPSPECERALPLIAAREDEQLEAGSDDDAWLDAHLASCERCRLALRAMQEADASYRTWAPLAVGPQLLEKTLGKAAGAAGAGSSEEVAEANALRTDLRPGPGAPPTYPRDRDGEARPSRRRLAVAVAGLAALLAGGGIAIALGGGEPSSVTDRPTAEKRPVRGGAAPKSGKERRTQPETSAAETTTQGSTGSAALPQGEAEGSAPSEPTASPVDQPGSTALQPPQATAAPKPKSKPVTAPPPAAAVPTTTAPPPTEVSTTTEEPPRAHPPKGPPSGMPPRGGPK